MPTKLKRYTVVFPPNLREMVERDAFINKRSISNQVVVNLDEFYESQRKAASLFTPQLPSEDRRETLVVRTPKAQDDQRQLRVRNSPDQDKS